MQIASILTRLSCILIVVLKSKKFERIIESLLTGIVAGFVVTYLISKPVLSINNIYPEQNGNLFVFKIGFENTGDIKAIKLIPFVLFVDNNNAKAVRINNPPNTSIVEPGDKFSISVDYTYNKNKIVMYIIFEYHDPSYIREFLNTIIGKTYKKIRWAEYDPEKNKVQLFEADEFLKESKNRQLKELIDQYLRKGEGGF